MYCSKCGNIINQGQKFCGKCGNQIIDNSNNFNNTNINPTVQLFNGMTNNENGVQPSNNSNQQYNYNQQQQVVNNYQQTQQQAIYNQPQNYGYQGNTVNQANSTDEELLRAYIGKNYDKMRYKGFNIPMCFFGMTYTLYRKMWLLSLIIWAINTVASIFLSSISFVVTIGINIFLAIKWKDIYIKHCREKIEDLKSENPNLSYQQLVALCAKKGGTTVVPVILITIWNIIVLAVFFIIVFGMTAGIVSDAQLASYETNSKNFVNELGQNCIMLKVYADVSDPTTASSAETILNYTKNNYSAMFPNNLHGKANMFRESCVVNEDVLGNLYYDDVVCSFSSSYEWECVSK